MEELIAALREQTAAINALVESNARLMMMLAEGDGEYMPATTYMDGTSCP